LSWPLISLDAFDVVIQSCGRVPAAQNTFEEFFLESRKPLVAQTLYCANHGCITRPRRLSNLYSGRSQNFIRISQQILTDLLFTRRSERPSFNVSFLKRGFRICH